MIITKDIYYELVYWKWSQQFVMMTITIRAVASSTNTMTFPERRSENCVRVHAITRKKEALDQSKQNGSRKAYIIKISWVFDM